MVPATVFIVDILFAPLAVTYRCRLKVVGAVHSLGRRQLFRRQLDKILTIPFTCTTMSLTSAFGITSDDALAALSECSRTCIERLCKHEPEQFEPSNEYVLSAFTGSGDIFGPTLRLRQIHFLLPLLRNARLVRAAVLVLLYERAGRGGLRVLLTTRSKELRSHPGQTALPGGKVEQCDAAGVVETAERASSSVLRCERW